MDDRFPLRRTPCRLRSSRSSTADAGEVHASFNLSDNLVVRGAVYTSVGRPDFNQYSGGVTLPDTERLPAPDNRIVLNNAAIKAWTAHSSMVRLEYYFQGVGQLSIGANAIRPCTDIPTEIRRPAQPSRRDRRR